MMSRVSSYMTLLKSRALSSSLSFSASSLPKQSRPLYTTTIKLTMDKKDDDQKTQETFWERLFPFMKNSKWKIYPGYFLIKNLRPDKVPSTYRMVYRSELETYANLAILGAGATTVLGPVAACIYLLQEEMTIFRFAEFSIFTLATSLTVASMYYVSLKVPLRIYYSGESDDYLAYVPSTVPYKTHKLVLRPGELLPPSETSQYKPWVGIQHTHLPTGRKLLLSGENFTIPIYYNKLLH